ncbi:hypothetical protein AB0J72_07960 [Dactylosporangium sp. NPDC049742]|uniref:hypothetical protein n=1 Tax=Dactylosporangium sp. NPDC049742 TaxID=3154737 RepID=UPI00342BEE42
MSDNIHPLRTVHVGTRRAEVDELLAPLIELLWREGLHTLTSCQDAGESNASWVDVLPHMAAFIESRRGWAFIDFPVDDGLWFLTALANAGPRDAFYARMTHWAAPDAWDVKIRPSDVAMFDWPQPSKFENRLLQVCFPVTDLPEMLRRLRQHQAGEFVAPAPADLTTVGRSRPAPVSFAPTPAVRASAAALALRATLSSGKTWDDPDPATLAELLAGLDLNDRHLVVGRLDLAPRDQYYLQVYLNDDRSFQVEFREGGEDRHYCAYLPPQPEAAGVDALLDIVTGWATDRPAWRDTLQWFPWRR